MDEMILKIAPPYDDAIVQEIKQSAETILNKEIHLKVVEDPSLVGGFSLFLNGIAYDVSIKTKLEDIREEMKKQLLNGVSIDSLFRKEKTGSFLKKQLDRFENQPKVYEYGRVSKYADGIAEIKGLGNSRYGELLEFEGNAYGLALDLNFDGVGAVMLSDTDSITAGSIVKGTGHVAEIGVGTELLGRGIDPVGRAWDGKPLFVKEYRPLESPAPSIMQRSPVNKPLETGILAIDSMIPIGRGQRELIIGDRQTGKTSIALSAIMNQKEQEGIYCIYCSIGQKASTVAQVVDTLRETGAMGHTIVVASTSSDSPAMQYLAPYAACAIAEYFMYQGKDALVIYDDLSKHAVAYRAMSLLLRRPSGREAYPGDVFYLHSRLLERAAKLNDAMGGGSLTALPIIETMEGDISAYIPTNVISITDGQIYLETELFHAGVRPAVNVGLSVSRVGRAAQHQAMKTVSANMRLTLAQYREMAVFTQFGADIDAATKDLLLHGERLVEFTKQRQKVVYSLAEQVTLLLALANEKVKTISANKLAEMKEDFLEHMREACRREFFNINSTGKLEEEVKNKIVQEIAAYLTGREGE